MNRLRAIPIKVASASSAPSPAAPPGPPRYEARERAPPSQQQLCATVSKPFRSEREEEKEARTCSRNEDISVRWEPALVDLVDLEELWQSNVPLPFEAERHSAVGLEGVDDPYADEVGVRVEPGSEALEVGLSKVGSDSACHFLPEAGVCVGTVA